MKDKDNDRIDNIEYKRKRELNRTLAYGIHGLGISEVSGDNTAEARVKDDITRNKG